MLQKLIRKRRIKNDAQKLKGYRYCSDMQDKQYGYYIRWIPLKNP